MFASAVSENKLLCDKMKVEALRAASALSVSCDLETSCRMPSARLCHSNITYMHFVVGQHMVTCSWIQQNPFFRLVQTSFLCCLLYELEQNLPLVANSACRNARSERPKNLSMMLKDGTERHFTFGENMVTGNLLIFGNDRRDVLRWHLARTKQQTVRSALRYIFDKYVYFALSKLISLLQA